MRRTVIMIVVASLMVFVAAVAHASNNGKGGSSGSTCWADPSAVEMGGAYVLHVTGLPTDKALNVWITDANGTWGYPFGMSYNGAEAWNETAAIYGTTTYTISGAVRGKTKIYASCSMEVV